MNSVVVDGKEYVKAKVLARELGYTTDYIGQLCRGEKVDAQLVGRSWYVNEDSLRNHKQSRYRSNKEETIKTVRKEIEARETEGEESVHVPLNIEHTEKQARRGYAHQAFYTRSKSVETPAYHGDETDLMPQTLGEAKTGTLRVNLADAQEVKIKEKSEQYSFTAEERPKLKFKGSLHISEVPDEEVESETVADEEVAVAEVEVTEKSTTANRVAVKTDSSDESGHDEAAGTKIKVVHRRPGTKKKTRNLPLEHNADGVVGMQRGRVVDRNPVGGTLKVHTEAEIPSGSSFGSKVIVVMVLFATALGVLATGLEQNIVLENGVYVTKYVLNFESVVAAAYDAFR